MNLKVEDGGMELPMLLDDDKNEVCDDIARKEALLARGRRKKTEKKLSISVTSAYLISRHN